MIRHGSSENCWATDIISIRGFCAAGSQTRPSRSHRLHFFPGSKSMHATLQALHALQTLAGGGMPVVVEARR